MTPSAGEHANPELRDMTRRFWVCPALVLPLVFLAMGGAFRQARFRHAACRGLGRASACHAGRSVGRLAILLARLGLDHQPAAQHVHALRLRTVAL